MSFELHCSLGEISRLLSIKLYKETAMYVSYKTNFGKILSKTIQS